MIQNEENLEENSILPFLINPLVADARGQVQFCQNLNVNSFEKGYSPCTKEFPDVKIKRQLLDLYLKGICNITSQYGKYTLEISSPTVRQEININSKFLNAIRENLTSNDIKQPVKHNLQKILAWLIFDYFVYNVDLIALARKLLDHKTQMMKQY